MTNTTYYITLWGFVMTLFLLSFVVSIYYGIGLFNLRVGDIIFSIIIAYYCMSMHIFQDLQHY